MVRPSKNDQILAATCIRMSSTQQEASPDQQRKQLAELAKKYNARIVAEYFDEGISGVATSKRRGFLQMLDDAKAGKFELILAWDQDRFSRLDSIDSGEIIAPLRRAGVRLVTCAQGEIDWTSFAGRLVFNVAQEGKNQFLHDLSRNMCRSLLQRGQAGVLFAKPPYGYERVVLDNAGREVRRVRHGETFRKPKGWTNRIVIADDSQLVGTVRWLFDEFAHKDCSLQSLAIELNRRGVKTSRGKAWRHDSIAEILSNRFYTGTYVFGKSNLGKFNHISATGEITKTRGGRVKNREPIIVLENHHDALVDQATFEKAQQRLQSRRYEKRRPRTKSYPMSGLLRCGHCGGALSGSTHIAPNGTVRRYYYCFNGTRGTCSQFRVSADRIEALVTGFVKDAAERPGAVAAIKAEVRRQAGRKAGAKSTASKELAAQIAKVESQIKRGQENLLLADPQDVQACQAMLSTWRATRDELRAAIDAAESLQRRSSDGSNQLVQKALRELGRLPERLSAVNSATARDALQAVFARVTLLFHPRREGERRFELARLVIQSKEPIHFNAGNRT